MFPVSQIYFFVAENGHFPRTIPPQTITPRTIPLPTRIIPPLYRSKSNLKITYTYAHMHTYKYTYIYTYMHTHRCMHTYAIHSYNSYMHKYIYIYNTIQYRLLKTIRIKTGRSQLTQLQLRPIT